MGPVLDRPRWQLLLVLCGGLATGLAIATAFTLARRDELIAAQLAAAVPNASAPRGEAMLAAADDLGAPAVDVFVAALAARDVHVARAGAARLWSALRGWETLPDHEAIRRIERLTARLSAVAPRLQGEARQSAVALTSRLLTWPVPNSKQQATRHVTACANLLRSLQPKRLPVRTATLASPGPAVATSARNDSPATAFAASINRLTTGQVPGGGLPLGETTAAGQLADVRDPTGGSFDGPAPTDGEPPTRRTPSRVHPASLVQREASEMDPVAPQIFEEAAAIPSPQAAESVDPRSMTSLELCRRTYAADTAVAAAATAELTQRGLEPHVIELGRKLASPDSAIRREWTEQLPQLAGFDAEPWLLELSRDADREVRRTALGILATMPGNRHRPRLAEMAAQDPDPSLRALAQQLLGR
ncbi:MAG: HEAT repeat domain-containing protein [Pirellulales bacterium]|nr:HEAT repeat domain-containing protein [Pirellulales bacterium]